MNDIINSDFFTMTIYDVMSPMSLYHFRFISKYIYNHITVKMINRKIISNVHLRLKYELKDHYETFINIVKHRNLTIHGPIINEAIWHEYTDCYIDIKINFDNDIGSPTDNIFTDFSKIYSIKNIYIFLEGWFMYESDKSICINNIRLYLISASDEQYDTRYEVFPKIFQNKIIGNQLIIGDIKAVMNKTYRYCDYYESIWFSGAKSDDEYCKIYNLKIDCN